MGFLRSSIKSVINHWHAPAEGDSLSYKEIALHSLGGNGVNLINGMAAYTGTVVGSLLTATAYGILPMDLWAIGAICALIGLFRMPIVGWIIDNTQTKWGKFRPLIIVFSVPTALLLIAMAFIPAQFMGAADYNRRYLAIAIISALLAFVHPTLNTVMGGLSQVMTMQTAERARFFSIINVTQNLFTSLMQIILPPLSIIIDASGGMESIKVYQICFPILAVIALGTSLGSVFGTQERAIIKEDAKIKVPLKLGISRCAHNKYFMLVNISLILSSLRGVANVMNWICIYQMPQPLGTSVLGIATTLCGMGYVPGMAVVPLLVKKFGKRNSYIGMHIVAMLVTLPMLLALNQPFVMLVMIFFQNLASGAFIMVSLMNADILDYEQYKSGERLEGFFNNFQAMAIAIFGIGTSLITPLILQKYCGINADLAGEQLENAYTVLRTTAIRNKVFSSLIIIASASLLLGMLPIFFYDLTDKKHAEIICFLKEQAQGETAKE